MRQRFSSIVIGLVVVVVAGTAHARSHFLYPELARPALVVVNGFPIIHAVTGYGESSQWLAVKSMYNDWYPADTTGGPPTTLNVYSGAVGATVDTAHITSWHAQAAVYVVGGSNSHLWQYAYDQYGVPTWRDVTGAGGPALSGTPTFAAAWVPAMGTMVVATAIRSTVRNQIELWTCLISNASTGACVWENENLTFPSGSLPVGYNSPIAIDPGCGGSSEFAEYVVTTDGQIERFLWQSIQWSHSRPASPVTIDTTAIQAFHSGTTCYAAAAGIDGISYLDTLQLATIAGSTYTWTALTTPTTAIHNIAYQQGAIAYNLSGTTQQLWVLGADTYPYSLRRCTLSLSGTPSCNWGADLGRPAEQISGGLGYGMVAYYDTLYIAGRLGAYAYYMYGYNLTSAEWQDHLTYRDANIALPIPSPGTTGVAEIVSDEREGTIVYAAASQQSRTNLWSWISQDDGSTITYLNTPFTPIGGLDSGAGDQNVAFDAAGTAFYVGFVQVDPLFTGAGEIRISRLLSGPAWRPQFIIPPTGNQVTHDRPWLAADRFVANRLYLTFSASNTDGRFAYCNGSGDCASSASAWCPADSTFAHRYSLPSATGCTGIPGGGTPGCWVDTDGLGNIWLTVESDTGCSPPAGMTSIGVHRIVGPLGTPCAAPSWGSPLECIYFVATTASPATQCNGGTSSPCAYRGWTSALSASRDSSGIISMTFRGYTRISDGAPCTTSSACRSEQYFMYRDPARGWCGQGGCSWTPTQSTMFRVNGDSTTRQEDHFTPSVVSLDYSRFATTWLDFRSTNIAYNHTTFNIASAFLRGSTGVVTRVETPQWPGSAGTFAPGGTPPQFQGWPFYGDINGIANGRGHAHLIGVTSPGSQVFGLTATQSAFTTQ